MARSVFAALLLFLASLPANAAPTDLERGVALLDPGVMEALDLGGLGIGHMVMAGWQPPDPALRMTNFSLSKRPEIQVIRTTLAEDFDTHLAALRAERPGESIGVSMNDSIRIFDKRFLKTSYAHFVLTGIVNRMDRAFKTPETCGEVRLLYRLNYVSPARPGRDEIASRLPMTMNLVFKAKDANDAAVSCADIAKGWLYAGNLTTKGAALLADLKSPQGPLRFIRRELIDRVEINLQLDRFPTRVRPKKFEGGSAAYLLRIFKLTRTPGTGGAVRELYVPATLENQIDRDRVLGDPGLKSRLKAYLLEPENIKKLDTGTLLIGDEFLAYRTLSMTPGNFSRSENRPYEGLLDDTEIKSALARLSQQGTVPLYIPTVTGFQHRLNDLSCTGCHQTRAIGGFHFMGHDRKGTIRANTVAIPASPHFFGDAPRRRGIITAFAENRTPDFSKAFSSRPPRGRSPELVGTGLLDGWGAHCHVDAGTPRSDASFASWQCAKKDNAGKPLDLKCQALFTHARTPKFGVCVTRGKPKIGDPADFGEVTTVSYGHDVYESKTLLPSPETLPPRSRVWRYHRSRGDDGFAGGLIRTSECPRNSNEEKLPKEAACGAKPRDGDALRDCHATRGATSRDCIPYQAKPGGEEGFNACITSGTRTFMDCLELTTQGVGLRACDTLNPCRDDYICTARQDPKAGNNTMPGACMPPYFLFQFRVDGHLNSLGSLLDR